MITLFRKRQGDASRGPQSECTELIEEFETLDTHEREMAAAQLSQFWEWFEEEFGGAMGFLVRPRADQDGYIQKVELISEKSRSKKNTDLSRFYYSAAFLSLYLKLLQSGKTGTGEMELLSRIDAIVE